MWVGENFFVLRIASSFLFNGAVSKTAKNVVVLNIRFGNKISGDPFGVSPDWKEAAQRTVHDIFLDAKKG